MSLLHSFLRGVAKLALISFYSEIRVIGEENVPKDGPILIVSTHHNMMVDPAVLSAAFPYSRQLHYWAKSTLFTNPVAGYILKSVGQIPVDRTTKDTSILYDGTFRALAAGEAIAVFPEGTSYTECRIMQVKEGASWATLGYLKWAREAKQGSDIPIKLIVVGITYTNKSKYRSSAILEFSKPLSLDEYEAEYMSSAEGSARSAAKKLSKALERKMVELSINAPDWETLYAGKTARDLLWPDLRSIDPDNFVAVSQTLIDLFLTPQLPQSFVALKQSLLEYDSLLKSSRFTNADLSSIPLSTQLDPQRDIPTPTRLGTLFFLVRDTISAFIRLPFFLFPFVIHLPIYVMGRYGARLAEDEEEVQAQNKLLFGLMLTLILYGSIFGAMFVFLRQTAIGGIIAAGSIYALAVYHRNMIDDNYLHAKKLIAAWRVLVGVWLPKSYEIPKSALKEYRTPFIPPMSPYIGRKLPNKGDIAPSRARPRGPPSRGLVRHVLRARIDAATKLAAFMGELERNDERVRASAHLARAFGGTVDPHTASGVVTPAVTPASEEPPKLGVLPATLPSGWRSSKEVIAFLRKQGANVKLLAESEKTDDGWAIVSSDGSGDEKK